MKPWRECIRHLTVFASTIDVHTQWEHEREILPWRDYYRRVREALELLHMISVAEQLSWKETYNMLLGFDPPRRRSPRRITRRSVELNLIYDTKWTRLDLVAKYSAFLFAYDELTLSDTFRTARREVCELLTPEATARLADPANRLPILLKIELAAAPQTTSAAFLTASLELVRRVVTTEDAAVAAAATTRAADTTYRFPFTLVVLSVSGLPAANLAPSALRVLLELLTLCSNASMGDAFRRNSELTKLSVVDFAPLVHVMTDASSFRQAHNIQQLLPDTPLHEMALRDQYYSGDSNCDEATRLRQIGALFSAISVSQSLEHLDIFEFDGRYSFATQQKVLQWIAYALFSEDARSNLRSLALRMEGLRNDRTDTLAHEFVAPNVAASLLCDAASSAVNSSSSSSSSSVTSSMFLHAGTLITIKPTLYEVQHQTVPQTFTLTSGGYFRAVDNASDPNNFDIIVPCYGHCTVARTAVDHVAPPRASSDNAVARRYGGSKLTEFSYDGFTAPQILPLLDLIGVNLTSLRTSSVTGVTLTSVLAACPNLRKLRIAHTDGRTERVLIDAYEYGGCQIEELTLDAFRGEEHEWQYGPPTAFVRLLGNPDSKLAKTLRSLTLTDGRPEYLDANVLIAYANMLTLNWTLEYLQFQVTDELFTVFKEELMLTNWTPLLPRPLPPAQRRAFLSVVRHFGAQAPLEPQRKRARHDAPLTDSSSLDSARLDRSLVELVFAFAGELRPPRRLKLSSAGHGETPPEVDSDDDDA